VSKKARSKKYNHLLKGFKSELRLLCKDSPSHCMSILNCYTGYKHHKLFSEVRYYVAINHRSVSKELTEKFYGKCLCGRFGINNTLHFIAPEICMKYRTLIPERKLLGGSLAVALQEMKKIRDSK